MAKGKDLYTRKLWKSKLGRVCSEGKIAAYPEDIEKQVGEGMWAEEVCCIPEGAGGH